MGNRKENCELTLKLYISMCIKIILGIVENFNTEPCIGVVGTNSGLKPRSIIMYNHILFSYLILIYLLYYLLFSINHLII